MILSINIVRTLGAHGRERGGGPSPKFFAQGI